MMLSTIISGPAVTMTREDRDVARDRADYARDEFAAVMGYADFDAYVAATGDEDAADLAACTWWNNHGSEGCRQFECGELHDVY